MWARGTWRYKTVHKIFYTVGSHQLDTTWPHMTSELVCWATTGTYCWPRGLRGLNSRDWLVIVLVGEVWGPGMGRTGSFWGLHPELTDGCLFRASSCGHPSCMLLGHTHIGLRLTLTTSFYLCCLFVGRMSKCSGSVRCGGKDIRWRTQGSEMIQFCFLRKLEDSKEEEWPWGWGWTDSALGRAGESTPQGILCAFHVYQPRDMGWPGGALLLRGCPCFLWRWSCKEKGERVEHGAAEAPLSPECLGQAGHCPPLPGLLCTLQSRVLFRHLEGTVVTLSVTVEGALQGLLISRLQGLLWPKGLALPGDAVGETPWRQKGWKLPI